MSPRDKICKISVANENILSTYLKIKFPKIFVIFINSLKDVSFGGLKQATVIKVIAAPRWRLPGNKWRENWAR